jgi:hypothetical protein
MASRLTLPGLQATLDRLPAAQGLALANADIERLFGFNDVALTRMKRFARGHNCIVSHTDSCVVFQKLPPPVLKSIPS